MNGKKPHWNSKEERERRDREAGLGGDTATDTMETSDHARNQDLTGHENLSTSTNEPSVPLSAVQKMIEDAISKVQPVAQVAQQNNNAPVREIVYKDKNDVDVVDIPELQNWEMRDRQYVLTEKFGKPITFSITKEHSDHKALQYTNKETQTVHPLRYASNQTSFFIDKQSKGEGSVLTTDIIFKFGMLKVPANNVLLQKFLAIHSDMGVVFEEYDPAKESRKNIEKKKLYNEAQNLVFNSAKMINRVVASLKCVGYIDAWTDEEVEEMVLDYAEKNPKEYIELAKDPTLKKRGIIRKALISGDLVYSDYRFMNRNGETLLEVNRNLNEYDEMVKYMEGGQGRSLYEYLQNLL